MTEPRPVEERRTTPENRTPERPRPRRSAGALPILVAAIAILVVAYVLWATLS